MKRGFFLDRDGVVNKAILLNGNPLSPRNLDELEILKGVPEAISLLKVNDLIPVVISNQPDVARNQLSLSQLKIINQEISKLTGIQHFYVCIHDDIDECDCRKPKIGLLKNAASDLDIDISKSYLVGDRWRDMSAGRQAGTTNYFIDYGYLEKGPEMPYMKVGSLLEAVQRTIGETGDSIT
jgi:D-glycero-D-manno-heptose 1,7-bisphosphate phosphatase